MHVLEAPLSKNFLCFSSFLLGLCLCSLLFWLCFSAWLVSCSLLLWLCFSAWLVSVFSSSLTVLFCLACVCVLFFSDCAFLHGLCRSMNVKHDGTALTKAAAKGHAATVQVLVEAGADLNTIAFVSKRLSLRVRAYLQDSCRTMFSADKEASSLSFFSVFLVLERACNFKMFFEAVAQLRWLLFFHRSCLASCCWRDCENYEELRECEWCAFWTQCFPLEVKLFVSSHTCPTPNKIMFFCYFCLSLAPVCIHSLLFSISFA